MLRAKSLVRLRRCGQIFQRAHFVLVPNFISFLFCLCSADCGIIQGMKTRIAGVFSKKSLLIAAFARAAIGFAASASVVEVEYTMPGGRVEREWRDMPETDGVCVFALSRDEIRSRGAVSIAVTPDFARARKGDDGFWVFSSGECGTFRCDEGKAECNRWQLMSVYGMKTPERTFAAIVKKLKYYFTTRSTAGRSFGTSHGRRTGASRRRSGGKCATGWTGRGSIRPATGRGAWDAVIPGQSPRAWRRCFSPPPRVRVLMARPPSGLKGRSTRNT